MQDILKTIWTNIKSFIIDRLKKITADTLEWLTAIVLHAATVPQLLAIITGLSDKTPDLETVLFIWSALTLLWARAIILKNRLNIITIGTGFIAQAVSMALIVFK